MYDVVVFFDLFLIYSIIGWIMETILCTIENKKIASRGFLIGPYCPIYGVGATCITLFLSKYNNDIIVLFVLSVAICSIVEYVTSYLMEKLFKARWWDYSNMPFNLNGRICLINSIWFGLGGTIISYIISPALLDILYKIPSTFLYGISITLMIIFLIDVITSFNIINKFKFTAEALRKDYSDEINEKVKEILKENSIFTARIIKSFPNFKINLNLLKKKSRKTS